MKAKKAIQQKMYHENSWGDGKQRLEELYVHFLTGASQTKGIWNSSVTDNCFERTARADRTDDNFFERIASAVRAGDNSWVILV